MFSVSRLRLTSETAAALQQANIVPVLSAGDTDGLPYYTMPYVDGESLRARLARGPLPILHAVSVLRDVARALAYAHARGVVHRDIKPDNVLLSGGTAVVTDFGIAKAVSAARADVHGATLTQVGTSIGTPAYMAPEQAAGDPALDQRADIYSLGCVAYELLSGRPPFAGMTPQRMLAAHITDEPKPVRALRPDTPEPLGRLVASCLAKDPARRPTLDEIVAQLETITGSGLSAVSPALLGGPGAFSKALLLYTASFVAVALLAKGAIALIGLPDWVFPGAMLVMAVALPLLLWTGYVQWVSRRALTATPTYTPGGTPSTAVSGTIATMALKAAPHASWHRTAKGYAYLLGAFVLAVAAFMLMRTLGIGPAATLFTSGKLSAHDRVLVDDFRSTGSDSTLGAVIAEGVRTNLAQSRVIGVMAPTAVAEGLRRMERPTNTPVTLDVARELAQRAGVKAVIDGTVTTAGQGFILTLRVVSSDSGAELASFQEAARDPTDIIPAIDRLTRHLRDKIGESLRSVHDSPPLMQVTTGSLAAWRKYTEGMNLHFRQTRYAEAAAAFEAAIRLDSGFALAYQAARNSYGNAAMRAAHADSLGEMAFRRRERLPDLERAVLEASYYGYKGWRDSSIAAARRAVAIDPALSTQWNQLGIEYMSIRDYARAESSYRRAIAVGDGNVQPQQNIATVLVDEGKFREASAVADAWMSRTHKSAPTFAIVTATAALMQGRYDSAAALLHTGATMPRDKISRGARLFEASFGETRGQLRWAQARLAAMNEDDRRAGVLSEGAAAMIPLVMDSVRSDFWIRERPAEAAVRRLDALVQRFPETGPRGFQPVDLLQVVDLYARAGRADRARATLARFDRDVRDSTTAHGIISYRRWAEGEIALAEHRYGAAIASFRALDSGYDHLPLESTIYRDALLGRAFDLAGMRDSAIAALERYVSMPYAGRFWWDAEFLAGSHKRLGELYEAAGNRAMAAEHYAVFIELWKHADPELQPRVAEVRRRLERLAPDSRVGRSR